MPKASCAIIGAPLRYKVAPRDIAPRKAARLLGLTLADFNRACDDLFARGFPRPDPTTGNYDSRAIARWQDARSGLAAAPLTEAPGQVNAVVGTRHDALTTHL
jgi:hypothetical protein